MKRFLAVFTAVFCAFFFISCDSEVKITSSSEGTKIIFSGAAGKGFEKLITSVSSTGQQNYIDTKEISSELQKSGFKNVQVTQSTSTDLTVSVLTNDAANFIYTSGILTLEDKVWKTDFSREKLLSFYKSADAQIVQFLDLLLAPVFNEEEMDVDEYLEVIGAFYGDAVAEELRKSTVSVTSLNGEKGELGKFSQTYSLAEILCGKY